MELAYQWDMLEDEIPKIFDALVQSVRGILLGLKSTIDRESRKLDASPISVLYHSADTGGNKNSGLGFIPTLVQGIDYRIQDIEYKFSLARQDFGREVKYEIIPFYLRFTAPFTQPHLLS